MATIRYFDAQGRESKKFTSACSHIKITGLNHTGELVRKRFSRARQGDEFRAQADAFYARLISEQAGLTDGDERGARHRNFQAQTFEWLARKYIEEHLIPHTRSAENKAFVETLILKWGKHRLCHVTGPVFRQWVWHALNHEIPSSSGKQVKYEANTIHHLITYARRVYSWGITEELIGRNPLSRVLEADAALCRELRRRKSARRIERVVTLTAEEFWSFINWPKLRLCVRRAAILSAYGGGMREGEVCGLKWSMIVGNKVNFSADDVKETDEKTVYLDQEAVDVLREIEIEQLAAGGQAEHVLITERGAPITEDSLSHSWLHYRRAYAAESNNPKFEKVTFHRLRNTYRTRKSVETDDIHAIARNMGHHELSMSFNYDIVDEFRMQRLTGFENAHAEKIRKPLESLLEIAQESKIPLEELQSQLRIMFREQKQVKQ